MLTAMRKETRRASPAPDADAVRWSAVLDHDAREDGRFVYGVMTTGVFCRPSCPSRRPLRKNVRFYDTPQAAERDGLRPCLRCAPTQASLGERHATAIAAACRRIEAAAGLPDLDALAATAGLSRFHFHRVFKRLTGLTPKAYGEAHRAARLRDALVEGASVTEAIYEAGFGSNGRFYAVSNDRLGMTPDIYRRGGAGTDIRFAVAPTSLGPLLVAATAKGLCRVRFGDDAAALARDLRRDFPQAHEITSDGDFAGLVARVVARVETPSAAADLPLDVRGTAFQERVWRALRKIPLGETASYADVARAIGEPKAARAVAQACGANPAAVVVPCHRVVRSDGGLSGYRWGVERKRALLKRENAR